VPAERGLILLGERGAPSPLLELARPNRLPQLCEAKSAQPYGDWDALEGQSRCGEAPHSLHHTTQGVIFRNA